MTPRRHDVTFREQSRMIRLALTGSIGMGKSTVAAMFERAGIPVFDADAVVRRAAGPGGRVWSRRSASAFPARRRRRGRPRRACAAVLGDRDELAALEAIVHPAVQARAHPVPRQDNADAPALLFDIPLLFETGGEEAFDKVIVVSAPAEIQRERVLARPGNDAREARRDPRPADARRGKARARRFRRRYRRRPIHDPSARSATSSLVSDSRAGG